MNGQENEIMVLARQAGWSYMESGMDKQRLEAFAKLVAAKEREACVVDIQMHIPRSGRDTLEYKMAMRMIERIRARS